MIEYVSIARKRRDSEVQVALRNTALRDNLKPLVCLRFSADDRREFLPIGTGTLSNRQRK